MKPTPQTLSALTALLLLMARPGAAAVVFVPGEYTAGHIEAPEGAKPRAVRFGVVRAQVGGGRVQAHLEAVFGDGPAVRGVGVVPLPAGVTRTDVSAQLDGKPIDATVIGEDESMAIYAEVGRVTGSSQLLTFVGRPVLLIPAAAIADGATLSVDVIYKVAADSGMSRVDLLLPGAPDAPVERLSVDLMLRDPAPIRGVLSPTHDVEVTRKSPREAHVRLRTEATPADAPLTLFFAADDDPVGLRVLTHRAEGDTRGYFCILGNPTGGAADEKPLPKDIVLVLDTSGSMRGEKLEQARSSVEYVLEHLNPDDRFNIITFGTDVARLSEDLLPNQPGHVARAREFIDDAVALGRTNISGALAASLAGTKAEKRPRIVIFLTDGAPTAGVTDPDAILASLERGNPTESKVFVLGLGADVDTHLLDQIASQTQGDSEYLGEEEEIDVKVAALYDSLSYPVLNGVELTFGGLAVANVYPPSMPALFRGREVLVLGSYQKGGRHEIALEGTIGGARQRYTVTADFPEGVQSEHDFVANLWASRRIGELLKQIRLEGRKPELIKEVVALSLQFGILTEYTEFLSTSDEVFTPEAAAARATDLLDSANMQTSGRWAVQQADNERNLRNQKVSTANMNAYKDRQGRTRKATKVQSVGRRAFYQRDGKWVQGGDAPAPAKKRRVKRFSKEHLQMVEKDADFAEAQRLDGTVIYNFADEQVELY